MITFRHVSKYFAGQAVLDDVSFQVNPRERIGIVGPNGAGKSTVFNLITGEFMADKGDVITPPDLRIGYVRQQLNPHAVTVSLLDYVESSVPELTAIQDELHELGVKLQDCPEPDKPALLRRLGELQSKFEKLDGYNIRNTAERSLSGMGFQVSDFSQPFRSFSGGWQSRAELARILVANPDVLLLDEPSNYLDIPTIEWLEKYLEAFKGTLILISHDRFFLNSLTNVTIEIANAKAERYPGNYDYYCRERALRTEQRMAAQKNQDRKREQLERFIERFRAKNTKATQVQSRLKQLEKMLDVEVPKRIVSPGKIRLRPPPHCGIEVLKLEDMGITYDGERWVLRGVNLRITRGEKLALIGYNGLGKTTLLRILAGKLEPSEGKRALGHKVAIGYQSQDFADVMDPAETVFATIRAVARDASEQEIRNILGGFGFSGDTIEKRVQVLSGGEKIRLAFARLLINPPNCLILDEPTTHLDIQAREALEEALQGYTGTICLVSHDIDFVRHVANGIVAMTPPGITQYPGGYDYYHQKMLQQAGVAAPEQAGNHPPPNREEESQPGLNKADRKELRRQRALERQTLYDKTKDLKKAIKKAESEVERLESEKAVLVQQLSAPAETTNFAALSRRLKELQYEIDIATKTWEQSSEALEKAMAD